MPFPPKFTAEQRTTIAYAVLDDGHSVAEAVAAAAAGDFGPAFTMSPSVAYKVVADERERRLSPDEKAEDLGRRLLALAEQDIARLEALPERGPDDARQMHALLRMVRHAQQLAAGSVEDWPPDEPEDVAAPGLAARIGVDD